jgi:hypothetical protein
LDTAALAMSYAFAPALMRIMTLAGPGKRSASRAGGRGKPDSTFLELVRLLLYIR